MVASGVPNPAAGGATLTNWTILTYLLERGHDVVVVPLLAPGFVDATGTDASDRLRDVRAMGAEVVPVEAAGSRPLGEPSRAVVARFRRVWRPEDDLLMPYLHDRDAVGAALRQAQADVAFVYHWEALAATSGVTGVPRLGVAVDLVHLPALYRWRAEIRRPRASTLRAVVRLQAQVRRQPQLMVRLMNACAASGDFAAHHAAWLRGRGATHCEYLRTPVPDPGRPAASDRVPRPRVLLIGHLKGTATRDGLGLFAHQILPRLERELGADGFEVRIVGGFEAPPVLQRALDRPSVEFVGHLEDPSSEFRDAHVMVVPTTIPLGTRVRILSAFSFGCCVVAHRSNALGIPELAHGGNVLLGGSGAELAQAVVDAVRDPSLRDGIRAGGRATYERFFAPPVAAGRIEEILTRIAP